MSHAECSCHAALLMSQNSESWTLSGNFTLSKALALQGKPMTHVVKDKRADTKWTEKEDYIIWHCCKSTPKPSIPPNKSTLACPVCEKKTASTTACQTAVAFPVCFTPHPKSDMADMLPGKTGPHR